jgi:hypothetical protein
MAGAVDPALVERNKREEDHHPAWVRKGAREGEWVVEKRRHGERGAAATVLDPPTNEKSSFVV